MNYSWARENIVCLGNGWGKFELTMIHGASHGKVYATKFDNYYYGSTALCWSLITFSVS
jgi:hypothetical protein